MSRNSKVRTMAEKLPAFPKVNNKKIQRDSFGRIIYVNHFRELKKIEDKYTEQGLPRNHPLILKEYANYSKMVMAYNVAIKEKEKINFKTVAIVLIVAAALYAFTFLIK
jgi:hypothetical protein